MTGNREGGARPGGERAGLVDAELEGIGGNCYWRVDCKMSIAADDQMNWLLRGLHSQQKIPAL